MRVKPSVPLAVGLTIAYTLVGIGTAMLLQPDGASFEEAFDDLDNSRYLVYMLAAGAALGVIAATLFGWWRDIFADDRRTVGRVEGWHRFVPLVLFLLVFVTTDYGNLGALDGELLGWIVAASVLVGISEELMFRGNVVVCLRRAPVAEVQVWLWSSVLFALIHLGNIGLDAPVGAAMGNTVVAFFGGTMFYVTRRVTGTILAPIVLHALWDFTTFTASDDFGLGALRLVVMVPLIIAVIVTRKNLFATTRSERVEPVGTT